MILFSLWVALEVMDWNQLARIPIIFRGITNTNFPDKDKFWEDLYSEEVNNWFIEMIC